MRVKRHFRTSCSTIDYIITDLSFNRISDKDIYFKYCVNNRMHKLNENYDKKIDKILSFLILHCHYDNMPIRSLTRIVVSLSKITTALSKGLLTLINK